MEIERELGIIAPQRFAAELDPAGVERERGLVGRGGARATPRVIVELGERAALIRG